MPDLRLLPDAQPLSYRTKSAGEGGFTVFLPQYLRLALLEFPQPAIGGGSNPARESILKWFDSPQAFERFRQQIPDAVMVAEMEFFHPSTTTCAFIR